jgi:hypothetical protein
VTTPKTEPKTVTQRETVLRLLMSRGKEGISAIELDRKWGIYRAAARINELRRLGHRITTIRQPEHTAVYVLELPKRETDLGRGLMQQEVFG